MFLDVLVGIAALVAILDYFGIKPKHPLWGFLMPLSRNWKLWLMLGLLATSLILSGFRLYFVAHHDITQRTSERAEPIAGEIRHNPSTLDYVWIPSGTFIMGCSTTTDRQCLPEESHPHGVTITKGFWIGQTEVTVRAYKHLLYGSGKKMPPAPPFNSNWADDAQPIVNVTWDDANWFCNANNGHLPTEAQWEYAAKGKSTVPHYGDIDQIMWYSGNSGSKARAVASKAPNYLGLYDMLGNVWEWVDDWYDEKYYENSPALDPHQVNEGGPEGERDARVLRGGSAAKGPELARLTDRNRAVPNMRRQFNGFRCVQDY
jgi:formylglycine-generating enzyme required for sulfatase activity